MHVNNPNITIVSDVEPIAGVPPGWETLPLLEHRVPGITFPAENTINIEAQLVEGDNATQGVAVFNVEIIFQATDIVESVLLTLEDCDGGMLPTPEVCYSPTPS